MSRAESIITYCRHALRCAAARGFARALVLVVLTVQFGLIQHAVEHGTPFPDTGCEVCIAGVHAAPPPVFATGMVAILASVADIRIGRQSAPAHKLRSPRLTRAPPRIS